MPVHVYAVVRDGHPLPASLAGVDGELVRLVGSDDLAAVVGDVPEGRELTEQDAVGHLELLTTLAADGPVLPMRLGTVAPDEGAVRAEVLDVASDDLRRQLAAVDGLVEVHLDVTDDEDARMRTVVAADPGIRDGVYGPDSLDRRLQVGERVAAHLADLRAADAQAVTDRLAPLVVDHTRRADVEGSVLRAAYLVRGDEMDAFDAALDDLNAGYGGTLRFTRVGPLPVFSFVLTGAAATRWGW